MIEVSGSFPLIIGRLLEENSSPVKCRTRTFKKGFFNMLKYLFYYLLLVNLVALILCWYDKRAAIHQKWRIKESTLLLSAALGGSVGFYLGMKTFRHKTKHLKFTVLVPLLMAIQSAGLIWFLFFKNA